MIGTMAASAIFAVSALAGNTTTTPVKFDNSVILTDTVPGAVRQPRPAQPVNPLPGQVSPNPLPNTSPNATPAPYGTPTPGVTPTPMPGVSPSPTTPVPMPNTQPMPGSTPNRVPTPGASPVTPSGVARP